MVTITKIGEEYNSQILEISGLSTDPKPVDQIDGVSIANGSTFKEIDTGKEYTYNESAETWHINKSASSGGGGGVDGEDGGYYTPGVTQPTTDTMQISFAPSKSDMPAVDPVTVNLPVSENSGQNVDLTGYAEKTWVQEGFQPKGNYLTSAPVTAVNGKTGAVNLSASDVGARPKDWVPTAQEVGALPNTYTPPDQTAEQVGADPKGTAAAAVSAHNTNNAAHNDIRLEIEAVREQLAAFLDVDDETLNELSELIAAIAANQTSIAQLTSNKVSVTDIIDNLTTSVANKPLSAAQGVALKTLVDNISASLANYQPKGNYALASAVPTKVSQLANDKGYLTEHQDISHLLPRDELGQAVRTSIPGLGDLLGGGAEEKTYIPDISGYMSVSDGVIVSMSQTYHTDYIALDGYRKIYAQYKLSSIGYAVAFFNASKALLTAISITGAGASTMNAVDMEVPEEAAYCMLSCYEYSDTPKSYITLIPEKGITERVDELDARTNPLNGKTIAVLGDSISSVAYTVPNCWQMIAEKTGSNFLDYGVSGSCFAVRSAEHTPSFLERAADMGSADAVLVMGGTNDAGKGILLGDWASTDNTTLYGALNALINLLRNKYPGRPIIFCTPIKRKYDKDDGFPKTMADLKTAGASTDLELWHCAVAIQAKCAVHGIPVIDLYNASGIGSGMSSFFRPDDELHPSILGECRIANMVQPVLEQQFLYTTEYAAEPINLVPTSIDTDGSVFNSTGYKDGYRLSSSGSVSAQAKCTVTGFMPFSTSQILEIEGVTMKDTDAAGTYVYNAYICFYDADFAILGATSNGGNKGICTSTIDTYKTGEFNGVHTYDFSGIDGTNVQYIRVSSPFGTAGSGSALIVTATDK